MKIRYPVCQFIAFVIGVCSMFGSAAESVRSEGDVDMGVKAALASEDDYQWFINAPDRNFVNGTDLNFIDPEHTENIAIMFEEFHRLLKIDPARALNFLSSHQNKGSNYRLLQIAVFRADHLFRHWVIALEQQASWGDKISTLKDFIAEDDGLFLHSMSLFDSIFGVIIIGKTEYNSVHHRRARKTRTWVRSFMPNLAYLYPFYVHIKELNDSEGVVFPDASMIMF